MINPNSLQLPDTHQVSKDIVIEQIARANSFGSLGFFVGAGFSKAMSTNPDKILNWSQLVCNVFKTFEFELPRFKYDDINKEGKTFPEITTEGLNIISELNKKSFNENLNEFKIRISKMTNWIPDYELSKQVRVFLKKIDPKWFITTNYDSVLEQILMDESYPINSDSPFIYPRGLYPIYHIHGSRTNSQSIIISQQDYIKILRPNDYRNSKLATLFIESTTIFMGYGLGDINILSSIDLAKNYYVNIPIKQGNFIQVVRSENPKDYCYYKDDLLIFETPNVIEFLAKISSRVDSLSIIHEIENFDLDIYTQIFSECKLEYINCFIEDYTKRRDFINQTRILSPKLTSTFLVFISEVINTMWKRCTIPNAFYEYKTFLDILIDIIVVLSQDKDKIDTPILDLIVNELDRLKHYIGYNYGQSHVAYDLWILRKNELSPLVIDELCSIAYYKNMQELIRFLKPN